MNKSGDFLICKEYLQFIANSKDKEKLLKKEIYKR